MANDGRLNYVTTATLASPELERDHAKLHPCPCRDAYATGEVVRMTGLWKESTRGPEFAAVAEDTYLLRSSSENEGAGASCKALGRCE